MPNKSAPQIEVDVRDIETFQFSSPNTCIEQEKNYCAESQSVLGGWIATFQQFRYVTFSERFDDFRIGSDVRNALEWMVHGTPRPTSYSKHVG